MVGLVKQGPSCRRAGERTGNTTPNALSPDAGPTRTSRSTPSLRAHQTRRETRPASRTRRLWNLRESVAAAPPPNPRARAPPASLSSAPPNLAPPLRPSLLATLNSREQTNISRRVTPLPLCPGNCTYYTLTSRVPAAQSQLRTAR